MWCLLGTVDGSNDEADSNHATVNSRPVNKGMVLPFVPLSITFEDIRYSVDMPEVFFKEILEIQLLLQIPLYSHTI